MTDTRGVDRRRDDGVGGILDIQEVACLFAVAEDQEGLTGERTHDELGDEFAATAFPMGVRAVHVERPDRRPDEPVRATVRTDHRVLGQLRRGVRRLRPARVILGHRNHEGRAEHL